MNNKLTTRDTISIAHRAKRILAYEEAGLYYAWGLGYNHLLKREDMEGEYAKQESGIH